MKPCIAVGVTGGIAAYKICSLIRLYKKAGANVRVVVTPSALNFVTKLTLQTLSDNEVYVENFDVEEYKPGHISLADEADIMVIAPATANTISKIANGICDNLLTSTACAFKKQIILAFFRRPWYIIGVNCGMSLRSILKGIGCVRSSFNLRIETNTCKKLKVTAKFDCLTGAQFYLLIQIAPTLAFR